MNVWSLDHWTWPWFFEAHDHNSHFPCLAGGHLGTKVTMIYPRDDQQFCHVVSSGVADAGRLEKAQFDRSWKLQKFESLIKWQALHWAIVRHPMLRAAALEPTVRAKDTGGMIPWMIQKLPQVVMWKYT